MYIQQINPYTPTLVIYLYNIINRKYNDSQEALFAGSIFAGFILIIKIVQMKKLLSLVRD
jgi:hypothetical protein